MPSVRHTVRVGRLLLRVIRLALPLVLRHPVKTTRFVYVGIRYRKQHRVMAKELRECDYCRPDGRMCDGHVSMVWWFHETGEVKRPYPEAD